MTQTLTNDLLRVEISSKGAELQSITDVRTGRQFLWNGDERFWNRRSPVLFPIVGAVWNAQYRVDGKTYEMGQHGFARDMEFEPVAGCPDDEVWFSLKYSDESLKRYPFRFRLEIGYKLEGERLTVMWRVVNEDNREITFQIGAHPAFLYPDFSAADKVHGYLLFNVQAPVTQLVGEKGCFSRDVQDMAYDEEGMVPVVADTFDIDTIVLADAGVKRVSLLDKERHPYVSVIFDAPVVGIWSPSPDCPFVCIEPWYGRADYMGYEGEYSEKPYAQHLAPGATFDASYMILFESL